MLMFMCECAERGIEEYRPKWYLWLGWTNKSECGVLENKGQGSLAMFMLLKN